jgi:hypothetical protein
MTDRKQAPTWIDKLLQLKEIDYPFPRFTWCIQEDIKLSQLCQMYESKRHTIKPPASSHNSNNHYAYVRMLAYSTVTVSRDQTQTLVLLYGPDHFSVTLHTIQLSTGVVIGDNDLIVIQQSDKELDLLTEGYQVAKPSLLVHDTSYHKLKRVPSRKTITSAQTQQPYAKPLLSRSVPPSTPKFHSIKQTNPKSYNVKQ